MPEATETMQSHEWLALQRQFEQYEYGGLLIKLVCVVLFAVFFLLRGNMILSALLVLILWLQEGIFRTSQARLGARLLQLELGLQPAAPACPAFQLHSAWLKTRPGTVGLIAEYARNAARPTVAFPYLVLFLLDLLVFLRWQGI